MHWCGRLSLQLLFLVWICTAVLVTVNITLSLFFNSGFSFIYMAGDLHSVASVSADLTHTQSVASAIQSCVRAALCWAESHQCRQCDSTSVGRDPACSGAQRREAQRQTVRHTLFWSLWLWIYVLLDISFVLFQWVSSAIVEENRHPEPNTLQTWERN